MFLLFILKPSLSLNRDRKKPHGPSLPHHRTYGSAIRRARIERGTVQEKLALIAEVDRSYVGRVERGDNNIAILTLEKLAHAMEMIITELITLAKI